MNLSRLYIENIAIIEKLDIAFNPEFTVITGETGAGKSILIDALSLALGEKSAHDMIRSGTDVAVVECVFSCNEQDSNVLSFLESKDIEAEENYVTFKRELRSSGRSKSWVNGKIVANNLLKEAGNLVVDLHGQHEHQSLLRNENHIHFLDAFGDYLEMALKVSSLFEKLKNLVDRKDVIKQKLSFNQEKRELWKFQKREIQTITPQPDEYEKLIEEKSVLENSEKIHNLSKELSEVLYEGEESLYHKTQEIVKKLGQLDSINKSFTDYIGKIEETKYLFQDLSNSLSRYCNAVKFDSLRLNEVNQRLYSLQQLMKKYGPLLEDVLIYHSEITERLNEDDGLEYQLSTLNKEMYDVTEKYSKAAIVLSKKRKNIAGVFEKKLEEVITRLGIVGSKFRIRFDLISDSDGWVEIDGQKYRGDSTGVDIITFEISTNPGEPLKPLVNIASGGEISRIMLALKSILAGKDDIPIMIFDEIDSGISGHIAQVVGEELKRLGSVHQIICITHLPQIAGLGADHLRVRKTAVRGRSCTLVDRLSEVERVEEIAKLIGGKEISEAGLLQARELLIKANKDQNG